MTPNLGDFGVAYQAILNVYEHVSGPWENPHNEDLMIWAQSGIIGFGLFLYFHWAVFKSSRQLAKTDSPIALATLVTIIISCSFNSSFLDTNDGALLVILVVLFLQPPQTKAAEEKTKIELGILGNPPNKYVRLFIKNG